ncbi:sialate O-acetylesterase [Chitinophaga sp. CF118]|uniref:sialate O-acetylesterase n=1 Tax=Chitinophaga sp. CF118 TaxID=1884367 RepID=UPI0008EAD41A|nr:sialate O-acetylesterase [Chitinophaga sp. CF118]SFD55565.1 sialate O-acetylesterase [Chitinophaga sp. CF118]
MKNFILLFLLLNAVIASANIKLPSVIGDHMVLQQNTKVKIWGWADAGERVSIKTGWLKQPLTIITGKDGRWSSTLSTIKAGGPYEIILQGKNSIHIADVWLGEVWLCSGQSNMDMTVAREDRYWCGVYNEAEEVATANYPQIRVFDAAFTPTDTVKKDVSGQWEICTPTTVKHFSAAAYFFARDLQQQLKVPVGLITTAYGASTAEAWISRQELKSFPELLEDYARRKAAYDTSITAQKKYEADLNKWSVAVIAAKAEGKDLPREPKNPNPEKDQHSPAVLYNGMVAPLIPYTIKGALWYQGESNTSKPALYRALMEALIANWRKDWQQGAFPFLYVQLANYGKLDSLPVNEKGTVLIREAQLENLSIPHTGMVVAIDNANPDKPEDIHPKNKQAIGQRFSLLARATVYGEKISYSGPMYQRMQVEGNKVRLYFEHTDGGLKCRDNVLKGFAIAGADKQFVWANATIEGNTVLLSSEQVPHPVAVRYAWASNPPANLYNKADLPASPFRTDK